MFKTSDVTGERHENQTHEMAYTSDILNSWNMDQTPEYQLDLCAARFLSDREVTDRDRLVIALRELAKRGYDVERRPVIDWTKSQMICSLADSASVAFGVPRESRRQGRLERMADRAGFSTQEYAKLLAFYPDDVVWETNPEDFLQEPYVFSFKGDTGLVEAVFQTVGFKTRLSVETPDDGSAQHYAIEVAPPTMAVL